jgi:N-acetylmuramoyl-L-alanine amidase
MTLTIDQSHQSPNYSARQRAITMLVLHATAGSYESALAWLTNRASRVSTHYLIRKDGHIDQLVPDTLVAWHAGRSAWRGQSNLNESSIGIELENDNTGHDPYPEAQQQALLALCKHLVEKYHIQPINVVRHLDIALPRGRKSDPAGFPFLPFLAALFALEPA